MQEGPKITIITACYNSERTIEKTIQSVLNQTYENIEYIIVDGASTDGTMDIVEKYRDRIDVVVSEKDRGVYDAFNKGVDLATGDYINFMNADDYFVSNTVVYDVSLFLNKDKIDAVYGNVLVKDDQINTIRKYGHEIQNEWEMCAHQSLFCSNEKLKTLKFDTNIKILADQNFFIRLKKIPNISIRYIDLDIAYFSNEGVSSVASTRYTRFLEFKNIMKENHIFTVSKFSDHSSSFYYQLWIKKLMNDPNSINDFIKNEVCSNVMIFGTQAISMIMYEALIKNGKNVIGMIDNNKPVMHPNMTNVEVFNEANLRELQGVEQIIVCIEGIHDVEIIDRLIRAFPRTKVVSWKEMVS